MGVDLAIGDSEAYLRLPLLLEEVVLGTGSWLMLPVTALRIGSPPPPSLTRFFLST